MKIKLITKYLFLFSVGGLIYCGLELFWRGHTHWTMFIVGGLCFIFCGSINELFSWDMPVWIQMLICSVGITIIEFISGVIINIIFQLNVWDYSNLPFNIMGQVCLLFSFLWFLLSLVAIWLDDWLRYLYFDEEKPHYRWW
jgi:uncharacterized membrane protein